MFDSFDGKLISQSIAIIASILLAFAIDAWWEEYQEQEEINELLVSLVRETQANLTELQGERAFHDAKAESAVAILEMMEDDPNQADLQQLDRLINDLMWWSGTSFATGTLDAIINSGGLKWVEPIELRTKLSAWKTMLIQFNKYEQQDWDTYHDKLLPFLAREANLAQLGAAADGRPGSDRSYEGVYKKTPNLVKVDHRKLLSNKEFHSLIVITNWDQGDFEAYFPDLLSHGEALLELTKKAVE